MHANIEKLKHKANRGKLKRENKKYLKQQSEQPRTANPQANYPNAKPNIN